jgi:hypothetical protein
MDRAFRDIARGYGATVALAEYYKEVRKNLKQLREMDYTIK